MIVTYNKVLIDITSEFDTGDTIVVTDSGGNTLTWTSPADYPTPTGTETSESLLSFISSLSSGENISISGKMQLRAYGGTTNFTRGNFLLGDRLISFSSVVAGGSNSSGAITATTGTVNRGFTNILSRSPYVIQSNQSSSQESVGFELDVDNNEIFNFDPATGFSFDSTISYVKGVALSDISPFSRDFIPSDFNGVYSTKNSATQAKYSTLIGDPQIYIGFDGYGYFEDGFNPEITKALMQSNTNISKLDDSPVRVPVLRAATESVQFSYQGEMTYSTQVGTSLSCDEQILYVSDVVSGFDSFMQRVLLDGGVFENNSCIENFEDANTIYPVDTIYITGTDGTVELITVTNVEECKYEPYKITFVNKFGALQDIWFYKRSNLSTEVENEQYRASVVSSSLDSYGVLTTGYSTSSHQYKNIYSSGKESLELNSGFYPESYNEIFKQLMLSEVTWINYENKTLPVNIKTSSIKYKTQLNDKLINYNIEVDFAFDKINLTN
jgi:hypothetical protein